MVILVTRFTLSVGTSFMRYKIYQKKFLQFVHGLIFFEILLLSIIQDITKILYFVVSLLLYYSVVSCIHFSEGKYLPTVHIRTKS